LPHMGQRDDLHYCLGCNGSGGDDDLSRLADGAQDRPRRKL
jgi:hypothetical protein